MIYIERVYGGKGGGKGKRFLIDRLWPRGIKKEDLKMEAWLKEVAPSNELRKWYHQDQGKWEDFRKRYIKELDKNQEVWKPLLDAASKGNITLLYGSKDEEHNQAVVLKEYLEKKLKSGN
jgi:uncharacterized protein YeaO (DUF488 family)